MSSKQRRAIKREPKDGDKWGGATDRAWASYFARLERTLQNTDAPWREQRGAIDDITPDLKQSEQELQAYELVKSQGYEVPALAVARETAARVVTALHAIRELPRQAPKHRSALSDLEQTYREQRAAFLTAEPVTGRLWVLETIKLAGIYEPPYVAKRDVRNESTGEVETVEVDAIEWTYEMWRDLPSSLRAAKEHADNAVSRSVIKGDEK